MLTSRAWWFLVSTFLLLAAGLLGNYRSLTLLGLSLAAWFTWEWLRFAVRVKGVVPLLRVEREVLDERGPVNNLWAGRGFRVRVSLVLDGAGSLPYLAVADRVPFGVEHLGGAVAVDGVLGPDEPLTLNYRIRCRGTGVARFEGLRVRLADLQGFFYYATFVPSVLVLRVLPPLVDDKGKPASVKRHNALPPPGIHRMRRPGSGSELLDLRDYVPGDPPKTIAWKVSARRDRLITKEFESEVPVRCTLFVDTSNSVRLASGEGKPLARLTEIAAAVVQASASIRDLAGLCLFDEHGTTSVKPDRSGPHLTQMLRMLADAAALAPNLVRADPETLLPLAYAFAQEVYPQSLQPAVNDLPLWRSFMAGFSGFVRRQLGWLERFHRRKEELFILCWWATFWAVLTPVLMLLANVVFNAGFGTDALLFGAAATSGLSGILWSSTSFLFWLDTLLSGKRRRHERWRKRLAALLSERYGLAPGGLAALMEDDDQFSLYLQRFLTEHQVPYALPLYDAQGRYQFAAPEKIPVLADALLRSVGRGRDNELFVLLADLLELDDHLAPLLAAVRVALSRHHQVLLVCPWPPGLELPTTSSEDRGSRIEDRGSRRNPEASASRSPSSILHPPSSIPLGPLREIVLKATTRRFHQAFGRVRRAFGRLGVQVVCAAGEEPVPLILDRLERLRTLRRKS
jgi:uncharacterized protein (DUF58 family)